MTHVEEIDKADQMLESILDLPANILTQSAVKRCLILNTFVCLNFQSSSVSADPADLSIIHYSIQTICLTPLKSYFISCVPLMPEMVVSKLHNTHMVKQQNNELIGKSGIISLDNLKSPIAVNQETQPINEKALL